VRILSKDPYLANELLICQVPKKKTFTLQSSVRRRRRRNDTK